MTSEDGRARDHRDRGSIDFRQDCERRYWRQKWDISDEQLKEALDQTDSVVVDDVENYLQNRNYI